MPHWLPFLFALAVSGIVTPMLIRYAPRLGWVAHPKHDRWHTQRTVALMGGIGIFVGTAAGLLTAGLAQEVVWLGVGGVIMFAIGAWDDRRPVRPITKIIAQMIAAILPIWAGYTFGAGLLGWASIPLTLLWIVGVTNAWNLIDGMDGLAGGLAVIAGLLLAAVAWHQGQVPFTWLALALVGGTLGFLLYNWSPAKIFMGDGGSLFLGYMLAGLGLVVQDGAVARTSQLVALILPVVGLLVPIIDTSLVTIMRLAERRSLSQGGTDHLMHRLALSGISEKRTVLLLWGIAATLSVTAYWCYLHPSLSTLATGSLLLLACMVFVFHIVGVEPMKGKPNFDPLDRISGNRFLTLAHLIFGREWKAIVGLMADVVVIGAAWALVYEQTALKEGLLIQPWQFAILLASKLVVFYLFGLYHGIWRFAGTPEMLRIGLANVVASGVVATFLFGFSGQWAFVFLLTDAIVTASGVALVRLGFRALRSVHYRLRDGHTWERVLLYGAGDAGLLGLRALELEAWRWHLKPIGFLDDDPLKKGLRLHGTPILGDHQDLERLVEKHKVTEILITANRIPQQRVEQIRQQCNTLGIRCRRFHYGVDQPESRGGDSDPMIFESMVMPVPRR